MTVGIENRYIATSADKIQLQKFHRKLGYLHLLENIVVSCRNSIENSATCMYLRTLSIIEQVIDKLTTDIGARHTVDVL
jgi:hypothetical protein